MSRPVVVLTGFAPFGSDSTNPSWDAIEHLASQWDAGSEGVDLVVEELPVTFADVRDRLAGLLHEHRPDLLIPVGLAAGTPAVRLERVAINLCDARIADNRGDQPVDIEVVAAGEQALFTTLPVKAMHTAALERGHRVDLSLSAGTFVCNAAMYHAIDLVQGTSTRTGFIHVPDAATVRVSDVAQILKVLVHAGLAHRGRDLAVAGGALS